MDPASPRDDSRSRAYPPTLSAEVANEPPSEGDRVLLGSGPVKDPDSHPRAVKSRAVQASNATRLSLRFLRDILSTSSGFVRRGGLSQWRCPGQDRPLPRDASRGHFSRNNQSTKGINDPRIFHAFTGTRALMRRGAP